MRRAYRPLSCRERPVAGATARARIVIWQRVVPEPQRVSNRHRRGMPRPDGIRNAWPSPGRITAPVARPSYMLIGTAKLNDVDPQTWLADLRPHRRHAAGPAERSPIVELEGAICKTGGMINADRIARIRIQLDDWQTAVWRRVESPITTTLRVLHHVIQAAIPFEFRADGKRYAIADPEWDRLRDKTYSTQTMRLDTLVDRGITQLACTYDFGDDRQHTITIEAIASPIPLPSIPATSTAPAAPRPKMSAAWASPRLAFPRPAASGAAHGASTSAFPRSATR